MSCLTYWIVKATGRAILKKGIWFIETVGVLPRQTVPQSPGNCLCSNSATAHSGL
jgi:hypothetical protein